jgi:hypothetical protein
MARFRLPAYQRSQAQRAAGRLSPRG